MYLLRIIRRIRELNTDWMIEIMLSGWRRCTIREHLYPVLQHHHYWSQRRRTVLLPPPLLGAPAAVASEANARKVAGAWVSNLACDRAALLDSSRTADNILTVRCYSQKKICSRTAGLGMQ